MDEQIPNQPEQPKMAPTEATRDPNKKYRRCSGCGQLKEIKSPWQELWRLPTMQEWIVLFMIAMMIFAAWAYKHDIQVCRDFIENGTKFAVGNVAAPNYTSQLPDITKIIINDTANVTVAIANVSTGGGEGNVSNTTK